MDNNEAAPDDIVSIPQVVDQSSDSNNENDSSKLTSESREDAATDVQLEQKDDAPEANVDTASSLESTNKGADSSISTNEDATDSERTSEQIAGSGDSETAAGNVSTEGVGEDTQAGQDEREPQVLNDVQRQDVSEEGRDEL